MYNRKYTQEQLDQEREYVTELLSAKGVREAENYYVRHINDVNMNKGINNLPQDARITDEKGKVIRETIESYKEAVKDKDTLFKEYVLNRKAFLTWLDKQ
ncbi:hypothetical protein ETI01_02290 [Macrococcoides caseolyticum]|uniref:hypothetical protein n=1 Tax=Macrococcoides caseolyticum TaxID=69966 RepID=UPI00105CA9C2|nr:hypothetical protein [Macrococcus caseolyticus]TDM25925.1 hypothetical protein ETI01_02290 [Macrococcus caseolyticus]